MHAGLRGRRGRGVEDLNKGLIPTVVRLQADVLIAFGVCVPELHRPTQCSTRR